MSQPQTKVIIVNSQQNSYPTQQQKQVDPLLQQLQEMKITSNLVKQINFNTAANKFQYLQQLLAEQYKDFSSTINQLSARQIKTLHRDIMKISSQVQKQKQPNSHHLLGNKSQLLDLHKRAENVIETKKASEKFLKLSQGMLNAVTKLEKQLDQHVKGKIDELNQVKK